MRNETDIYIYKYIKLYRSCCISSYFFSIPSSVPSHKSLVDEQGNEFSWYDSIETEKICFHLTFPSSLFVFNKPKPFFQHFFQATKFNRIQSVLCRKQDKYIPTGFKEYKNRECFYISKTHRPAVSKSVFSFGLATLTEKEKRTF